MKYIAAFVSACLIISNASAWSPSQTAQDEPAAYPSQKHKKKVQQDKNEGGDNAIKQSPYYVEQLAKLKNASGELDTSLMKNAANSGNAVAQFLLAVGYFGGDFGLEKNIPEAVEWAKKASDQGVPDAQVFLGSLYIGGDGLPQDLQAVANYWTMCAANTNEEYIHQGKSAQQKAKDGLNDPELYPYRAKAMAAQMAEKEAKEVSDPDAGKDGGPPTLTVIKLAQGNSSVSMQNDMSVIAGAIMQGVAQVKIKEIRRGEPLQSLVSLQIPTGTKVYPIRIVSSGQGMDQTQDFYFYKDSFGDWAQVQKPAN